MSTFFLGFITNLITTVRDWHHEIRTAVVNPALVLCIWLQQDAAPISVRPQISVERNRRRFRIFRQENHNLPTAERASRTGLAMVPALIYFLVAYVVVTVLAAGLTMTYGAINHSPDPQQLGFSMLEAPAFVATVPYHVLIMLLIWPLFAWLYFRKRRPASSQLESKQTLLLATLWLVSAMVVDFVGFVLIKNSWSMTPRQLYVDYQPWITLIYISIFLSPWIRLWLSRRRTVASGTRLTPTE